MSNWADHFNGSDNLLDSAEQYAGAFFLGPANIGFNDFVPTRSRPSSPTSESSVGSRDHPVYNFPESQLTFSVGTQADDPVELGPRLSGPVPFDDGSVAFGTIRLYDHYDELYDKTNTFIRGRTNDDLYPNMLIKQGLNKRWIRTDGLSIGTRSNISSLRVYVLPEDVDRSNRDSLKDFRRLIRYLLDHVDCSINAWTGKDDPHGPIHVYHEPLLEEEESLFYIFNTLHSPETNLGKYRGDAYGAQAISDVLENKITGLKTRLYPYQQRSIAAMAKRESDPAQIRDLRKNKYLDIYGREFFFDLKEGSLCRHRPLYTEPQGGILAETMGYGKTLICLALILATRGHYPKIPPDHVDLTKIETQPRTASLLEMTARRLKYEGLPWKSEFYNLKKAGYHYDRCIDELQKHERVYDAEVRKSLNPSRKGKPEYSNLIRLCSATLVVVPPNLMVQWRHEINRHIDQDGLDLLVVDKPDVKIPPWPELVKYDIVLISKARFEQEYRDDDLNQGRISRGEARYKSPLTEVRWLRVICDEGHGFAGSPSKTNAMAMLDKMAIERRWVVSGTPSSTLHGVEIGLAAVESTSPRPLTSRKGELLLALKHGRSPESQQSEKRDFERLRLMVVNFLKLQPWVNNKDDKADFKKYLSPRLGDDGKQHSIPALREVLQTLIIRHRIEDVDRDLTLPPLHNKVVYIEPSYYDKLTINLFTMILITNYVTSEREDEDYMFHPKNRKKLSTLINNMAVGTFHWMGHTEKDVKTTIDIGGKYLDMHIDKVSDQDGKLLTEAILNGERALADPGWRAFSTMHEIGTFIGQFPEEAREAWALDSQGSDPLLMGTTQAREVQRYVRAGKLTSPNDPLRGLVGAGIKTMGATRERAIEYRKQNENEKKDDKEQKEQVGTKEGPKVRKSFANQMPMRLLPQRSSEKNLTPNKNPDPQVVRPEDVHLPESKILGFSSGKLTYLAQRLLHVHPNEKTIIFYTNDNTAFFVAEALELSKLTFRIYASTLAVSKRAEYLAQFNTDDDLRVLLMDLKQAALGLHVAAASRVYIVSPIWNPSLESQAIKRAHRIGQTREVFVETLVLAGTFEEAMVRRKAEKSDKSANQAAKPMVQQDANQTTVGDKDAASDGKDMLDDSGMVNVLKNVQFLKIKDSEEKFVRLKQCVPLFDKPSPKENYKAVTESKTTQDSDSLGQSKCSASKLPKICADVESRPVENLSLNDAIGTTVEDGNIPPSLSDSQPQSSSIFGPKSQHAVSIGAEIQPAAKRNCMVFALDDDDMAEHSVFNSSSQNDGRRSAKRAKSETPSNWHIS
ncbi:hypothetical protein H2198_004732 [Neophaeococcomyces mojaviensis]|uniref:Uncharacterized protein n=1 Tax=Neophaeococcomyces mojaviensis TaxID=3383035 RepID=A0ACC3A7L7_9EURO|nr:hypothetical protein H2198_004732 [Knufia sp. JES_112]